MDPARLANAHVNARIGFWSPTTQVYPPTYPTCRGLPVFVKRVVKPDFRHSACCRHRDLGRLGVSCALLGVGVGG
ncbi:hypothetical protein FRAHR75_180019 [Frankia sp. Hr75.2]|nr:hypothetical protein FRAHR75_180019 [Frankia sp. Hr75.2]